MESISMAGGAYDALSAVAWRVGTGTQLWEVRGATRDGRETPTYYLVGTYDEVTAWVEQRSDDGGFVREVCRGTETPRKQYTIYVYRFKNMLGERFLAHFVRGGTQHLGRSRQTGTVDDAVRDLLASFNGSVHLSECEVML